MFEKKHHPLSLFSLLHCAACGPGSQQGLNPGPQLQRHGVPGALGTRVQRGVPLEAWETCQRVEERTCVAGPSAQKVIAADQEAQRDWWRWWWAE